jgi:hypothetical protein
MPQEILKCPVCGKPLTQAEYEDALGLWEEKQKHIKHLETERMKLRQERAKFKQQEKTYKAQITKQAQDFKKEQENLQKRYRIDLAKQMQKSQEALRKQLLAQRIELQKRQKLNEKALAQKLQAKMKAEIEKGVAAQKAQLQKQETELRKSKNKMAQLESSLKVSARKYQQANEEIKKLRKQIEKGITPQIEGLLEEDILLAKLQELFPSDEFSHPGKGGDIVQNVIEQDKQIGRIVYECKKVKSFNKVYISQAKEARRIREADFAILVTNVFPSKKQYYFVEKTVFVISPISLEPITQTLRDSLVRIAMLSMSNEAKIKAVQKVYSYLSSNEYSNKVNDMTIQLMELGKDLKGEISTHRRIWEKRYNIYKTLHADIGVIDRKLRKLIQGLPGIEVKMLPPPEEYPLLDW